MNSKWKQAVFMNSSQDPSERGKTESKRNHLNEEGMARAMSDEEGRSGKAAAGRISGGFMKVAWKHWLFVTAAFVIGCFLVLFGFFSAVLPWSLFLQKTLSHFIAVHSLSLCLYGITCCCAGILVLLYTYEKARHHYIHMCIGKWSVSLDENIVRQSIEYYWKKYMPNESIPFSLSFQKRSLQITAEFPSLSLEEQKSLLETIQADFRELFGSKLGYPYEVHLKARFK